MEKEIKYQLQKGKEDSFVIDSGFVAFKNGNCFPVYISSKSYSSGLTIGKVRAVFSADNCLLSVAQPLLGLNNDYEMLPVSILEDFHKKWRRFNKMKKKNFDLYRKRKKWKKKNIQ